MVSNINKFKWSKMLKFWNGPELMINGMINRDQPRPTKINQNVKRSINMNPNTHDLLSSHLRIQFNMFTCLFHILFQLIPMKFQASAWVNPSKRLGMDGFFQGLAGLLRGISRGQSLKEILRSSPASPRKNPVHPDSFTWIYIIFKIQYFSNFSEFFKY